MSENMPKPISKTAKELANPPEATTEPQFREEDERISHESVEKLAEHERVSKQPERDKGQAA